MKARNRMMKEALSAVRTALMNSLSYDVTPSFASAPVPSDCPKSGKKIGFWALPRTPDLNCGMNSKSPGGDDVVVRQLYCNWISTPKPEKREEAQKELITLRYDYDYDLTEYRFAKDTSASVIGGVGERCLY
eukprot:scaffold5464_cov97-Skeletonema_dohrnii-CCMP3373.AAC.6